MNVLLFLTPWLMASILYGCQNNQPATQEQTQVITQGSTAQTMQTVNIAANVPFTLQVGQTGIYEPIGATIRFAAVKSDTRCLTGMKCSNPGEAIIQTNVKGFLVTTDAEEPVVISNKNNPVMLGGDAGFAYTLQFIDLLPHPQKGKPVSTNEYKATLKLIVKTPAQ